MQKKSKSNSAFFSPRVLVTLVFCLSACSIVTGSLLGFLRPEPATRASQRTLTFAERVAYQRAIEDVYCRHRLWPKERPDSKPLLDAVMSQAQLEKKVTDYLRKSQALEDYWQRPISAEQLQAEMDRMAKHTRQPDVLRELFAALGNDPFVIAECLARPALAARLLTNWYAYDERIHGDLKRRAEAQLGMHGSIERMKQLSGTYSEVELHRSNNVHDEARSTAAHGLTLNSAEWEETIQTLAATFTQQARKPPAAAYESMPIGKLSPLQEDETYYYAKSGACQNG